MASYNPAALSNYDLTKYQNDLRGGRSILSMEQAQKFAQLVLCLIIDPGRFYPIERRLGEVYYTADEVRKAGDLRTAFFGDVTARNLLQQSPGYTTASTTLDLQHEGEVWTEDFRFFYPIWSSRRKLGAVIKPTSAKTRAEFLAQISANDYDRQAALGLDVSGNVDHLIIALSKPTLEVWIFVIGRASEIYATGRQKYLDLALHMKNHKTPTP